MSSTINTVKQGQGDSALPQGASTTLPLNTAVALQMVFAQVQDILQQGVQVDANVNKALSTAQQSMCTLSTNLDNELQTQEEHASRDNQIINICMGVAQGLAGMAVAGYMASNNASGSLGPKFSAIADGVTAAGTWGAGAAAVAGGVSQLCLAYANERIAVISGHVAEASGDQKALSSENQAIVGWVGDAAKTIAGITQSTTQDIQAIAQGLMGVFQQINNALKNSL